MCCKTSLPLVEKISPPSLYNTVLYKEKKLGLFFYFSTTYLLILIPISVNFYDVTIWNQISWKKIIK